MAEKIANLRIFPDEAGLMNRSVLEAGGAILLVSQFTLHGDARKGRRPSFITAAKEPLRERTLRTDRCESSRARLARRIRRIRRRHAGRTRQRRPGDDLARLRERRFTKA